MASIRFKGDVQSFGTNLCTVALEHELQYFMFSRRQDGRTEGFEGLINLIVNSGLDQVIDSKLLIARVSPNECRNRGGERVQQLVLTVTILTLFW